MEQKLNMIPDRFQNTIYKMLISKLIAKLAELHGQSAQIMWLIFNMSIKIQICMCGFAV